MKRIFGHIAGVPVGSWFPDRQRLHESGVHRPTQAGISGSQHQGADSIVVSGGYEDDKDYGNRLIYTGAGGNNPATGEQIDDQQLVRGNLALVVSEQNRLPVRVTRGSGGDPSHSPSSGYRYDGLYRVDRHWSESGRSGFEIWRFEFVELADQTNTGLTPLQPNEARSATSADPDRNSSPESFICITCHRRHPRTEMSLSRPGQCTDCRLRV